LVNLEECLSTLANEVRLKIFKYLYNSKNGVRYKDIYKYIYPDPNINKTSSLNSHLKKMITSKLIIKQNQRYYINTLGKNISEYVFLLENYFEKINKEYIVRTSNFLVEPFDSSKITKFLIDEGKLPKKEAQFIANIVREKILNSNIEYLTTPLIREIVNGVLLENKLETTRRRLTRLGVPPNDVFRLLNTRNFSNPSELFEELGKHVYEQNFLLNIIPIGSADYYLKGALILNHPEFWSLLPLELVISGRYIGQLIINEVKANAKARNTLKMEPLLFHAINLIFHRIKEFFIRGILITEFEYLIEQLMDFLDINANEAVEYFFSTLPDLNTYSKTDPRHIHNYRWEIWLELDLSNRDKYNEIIESIINYYFYYIEKLIKENTSSSDNYPLAGNKSKKNINNTNNKSNNYDNNYVNYLRSITKMPTLIITIDKKIKKTILNGEESICKDLLLEKILLMSSYLNINFINSRHKRKNKSYKVLLTPSFTPVKVQIIDFADQKVPPFTQIIMDKIVINLPRILQITEEIPEFEKVLDKRAHRKDREKFLNELLAWVLNTINLFDLKYKELKNNISKFKLWNYLYEVIFQRKLTFNDTELQNYDGKIKINCSVALNGLIDVVRYFTGEYPDKNVDAMNFCLKIIDLVVSTLRNNSKNPNVEYIFAQPDINNLLQNYFIRDANILQNMAVEYKDIPVSNYLKEFEMLLTSFKDENKKFQKNYDITNYIEPKKSKKYSYLKPYWVSLIRNDLPRNFDNTLKLFKQFQDKINLLFLDLFIGKFEFPENISQIAKVFKIIIQYEIKCFGFTRILESQRGIKYYRHAGCYFPIYNLENLLQQCILKRRDAIDLLSF